jgi:broad specificity phosphatase PhoE
LWGRTPGISLNEKGRLQAQRLADRFRDIKLHSIHSSPVETAEMIARAKNLEIKKNPEFHEINFGEWTGKSFEVLSSDECWRRFNGRRSATRVPGGESFVEVQTRIVRELDALSLEYGSANIAIVSHADVIKAAVGYFSATPIDMLHRFEISPCSISVIAMDNESARLLTINNRCELDQLWSD